MKLPKQEFKLMTRIKLIQFWTCFTGIVLTHPRNMYLWSVFWGVMLMYLPMVIGVFEIIMLRLRAFKDYGQLIFHVFVCLLWQLGFALLAYFWATEENLTTLSHVLFYMNLFLGILFLLEMAIFIHVVRARINFLKRIDNEIEEKENQEAQEEIEARTSTLLARSEFISREVILEKEKQELIQSIKVRLESEMKLRESEEILSANFRPPRSNEVFREMEEVEKVEEIVQNYEREGLKQMTMDTKSYSEQVPTTSKTFEEEPSTSKANGNLFAEDPITEGDESAIDIRTTSDSRRFKEDTNTSINGAESSTQDPSTNMDKKLSTESPKTDGDPRTSMKNPIQDSTKPNQKTSEEELTTPETGGENPVKDKDVHPNETESIAEENLKEEEDEDKISKTELEKNH